MNTKGGLDGDMTTGLEGAVFDRERGAEETELRKKREVEVQAAAAPGNDLPAIIGCDGGGAWSAVWRIAFPQRAQWISDAGPVGPAKVASSTNSWDDCMGST